MKKLLAIVTVVAMMLSMSIIASADQSATIAYDSETKTATITISTTAYNTFDVAVYSDSAVCSKAVMTMDYNMNVKINPEYLVSDVANAAAADANGKGYAVVTGAGTVQADGADVPYEGTLATLTYENVEAGTVFTVVTGSAQVSDITTAPVIATLTAEAAEDPTPEPTDEPTPEPTDEPTPEPTDEPDEPTAEPDEPTAEPEEPTAEPEEPTAEPDEPVEPEEPTDEPSKDDEEPSKDDEEPAKDDEEPAKDDEEPAKDDDKTAADDKTDASESGNKKADKTADVAPIATMITLVVVAGIVMVTLKKRATN